MSKKLFFFLGLLLVFVFLLETGIVLYQNRLQKSSTESSQSDRSIAFTTPTAFPTQPASLPVSSPNKFDVNPAQLGPYLVWQDGIFLYRASASTNKNVSMAPYALTGVVISANGREFEITPSPKSKMSVLPGTIVRLKLLDKLGEVATLARSNGKISSPPISYLDLKRGDEIEAYSLQFIAENYYGTTQIFVLK